MASCESYIITIYVFCTCSKTPIIDNLQAYLTSNDLKQSFRSNKRAKIVA